MVIEWVAQHLDSTYGVENNPEPMHVGVFSVGTALVPAFGNSLSCGFMFTIEFHFIKEFLRRSKKLSLFAFLKEFLMFVGPIRQKKATTCGDFKGPRRVLVGTNLS